MDMDCIARSVYGIVSVLVPVLPPAHWKSLGMPSSFSGVEDNPESSLGDLCKVLLGLLSRLLSESGSHITHVPGTATLPVALPEGKFY